MTKPMAPPPSGWQRMARAADTYRGACPAGAEAPRNVVLFHRATGRELVEGARQSSQHHRFVLLSNLGTDGSVGLDGAWLRLRRHEALLVFPYQLHTYAALAGMALSWAFLTFELADPRPWSGLRGTVVPFPPGFEAALEEAAGEWNRAAARSLRLPYLAGDLLARMRSAIPRRRTMAAVSRPKPWLTRVHNALPPSGPGWSLGEIASRLGVSEPHLRAKFRRETGLSLGHYLRQIRLHRAAGLLHGADRPRIAEVALACGYDSPYSFSRSFRRAMGCPPRAYRLRRGLDRRRE